MIRRPTAARVASSLRLSRVAPGARPLLFAAPMLSHCSSIRCFSIRGLLRQTSTLAQRADEGSQTSRVGEPSGVHPDGAAPTASADLPTASYAASKPFQSEGAEDDGSGNTAATPIAAKGEASSSSLSSSSEHADAPHTTSSESASAAAASSTHAAAVQAAALAAAHAAAAAIPPQYREHKDEAILAVAIVALLGLFVYWTRATVRRTERMCEAAIAEARDLLSVAEDDLGRVQRRWEADSASRDAALQKVLDENAALTKSIDRMTGLLRQCER